MPYPGIVGIITSHLHTFDRKLKKVRIFSANGQLFVGFAIFDTLARVLFPVQLEFATIFRYLGWMICWLAGHGLAQKVWQTRQLR
jgi:hypothetical protein